MPDPWDRPPFPGRGNSQRTLYEAIGRALMAWEEVEGAFAHLYSTFLTGWPFDVGANHQYGEPLNFVHRVDGLRVIGCRYFYKHPSQALEGEFDVILRFALGWSGRRNDVAHGRARPSSWIIESETQGLERYCVIPPHFRAAKFTEERPAYVLSSREIRRFGEAFWELAHAQGRREGGFRLQPCTLARALHLGSFRTYRGRTIADINANPQSISPKSGSGYLPGGDGPPCSARPILAPHRR
jgi:hypothetical protein